MWSLGWSYFLEGVLKKRSAVLSEFPSKFNKSFRISSTN